MKLPFTLFTLLAFSWSGLADAQIYRWVDAQGQVHFEQHPRQGSEQVEVKPQVIQREDHVRQSELNRARLFDVREQEREEQREQSARLREQQAGRCSRMRELLARYDNRVYWYEEDASGRRVEVSNERVKASKASLNKQIQEQC